MSDDRGQFDPDPAHSPAQAPPAEPVGHGRSALSPYEIYEQERATLTRLTRLTFLVLFVTVAVLTILDTEGTAQGLLGPAGIALRLNWNVVAMLAVALGVAAFAVDVLTTRKKISTLISIFVGLVVALLATYALGRIIDLLVEIYDVRDPSLAATAKVLMGIALAYLSVVTVLQTKDDFRLVIPYVEFSKQMRGARPMVVDTSALIDGRLADIAATGVVQAPLVVPRFVVEELQQLADAPDKSRRARGRRGLDVVTRLQRTAGIDLSIDESPVPGMAVDQMVVELARRLDAMVVTTDSGLGRVAAIQGLRVLSVHDLAAALRPTLLPGEPVTLRLIRPGEQPGQAVGFLDDGTMVVAEDGRPAVGQEVTLTVVSTLQTAAGRMVFGRMNAADDRDDPATGDRAPEDVAAAPSDPPRPEPGDDGASPDTASPPPRPAPRGPYPPKPPNRRVGSARNPRR